MGFTVEKVRAGVQNIIDSSTSDKGCLLEGSLTSNKLSDANSSNYDHYLQNQAFSSERRNRNLLFVTTLLFTWGF